MEYGMAARDALFKEFPHLPEKQQIPVRPGKVM